MKLDEECKGCLYSSQLKKVEKSQSDLQKIEKFKGEVKKLCQNPPEFYCAPLLMRDIDGIHKKIFGAGIDYSKEKYMFNSALLKMEQFLFDKICASDDMLKSALSYAMSANYIDFARISDLNEDSIKYVTSLAEKTSIDKETLDAFKKRLSSAHTLLYLHDNCGEIVCDKILIRIIKKLYPQISVTSVVRGGAIINDVTMLDAEQVKLGEYATVISNGSNVPGTYLKEVNASVLRLLQDSDVILSKGLGNLETLYGGGYKIFYAFNCKCNHISQKFSYPLWSPAFVSENAEL